MPGRGVRVAAGILVGLASVGIDAACLPTSVRAADSSSRPLPAATRQLVLVLVPDWQATAGRLQRYARDAGGGWAAEGDALHVVVGRGGSGWGLGGHQAQGRGPVKREGDGRSPAGVFAIGPAFGSLPRIDTRLDYLPLDGGHWCIDVPDSPHYNRIVHEQDVGGGGIAGSSEPMRRDIHLDGDPQYRLGFVIGHNRAAQPDAGSCIFAHLWIDEQTPTAGCIGMAEPALAATLAWLDAAAAPQLVLLPDAEYRRLRDEWELPDVPEPLP